MNNLKMYERPIVYRRKVFTAVAISLGVAALLLFLYGTAEVLLLLFIAVLLAIIFSSLSHWLETHTPLSRNLSLALVVISLIGVIVLVGLLIGPSLINQFDQLAQQIPQSLSSIEEQLGQYTWGRQLLQEIPNRPESILSGEIFNIFARLNGVASAVFGLLGNVFLLFFVAIFLSVEPQTYIEGTVKLLPPPRRARATEVMYSVADTLLKWLITRFISIFTVGIITTLGLFLLDMPLALSLGIIAGLFAFIPTIGPIVALIPAILVGFLQSPQTALYVFLLYMLAQGVDNYIATPIVIKRTVRIPPALIIAAQLIGGALFGTIGVVMAAPLAAAGMTFIQMVYVHDFLEHRGSDGDEGEKLA